MTRPKRIILIFAAIVALFIVIITVLLATFDDEDYKRLLIELVERRTGYKVVIGGDFSIELSAQPRMSASDISLEQRPDGPKPPIGRIGHLEVQLAAVPLVTGKTLIRQLTVEDVTASWVIGEHYWPKARRTRVSSRKKANIPIFEEVDLRNIRIDVSAREGGRTEEILLERFDVHKATDSELLHVNGDGSINNYLFNVDGHLGSIADALDNTRAYPVKLDFNIADFSLKISGTFDKPVHGRGLKFALTANEPEFATLLKILKIESPGLGALDVKTIVTGDVAAPRLSDLSVKLGDHTAPVFVAEGEMADARTGKGTDVEVAAAIENKTILQWLTLDRPFAFSSVNLSGNLLEREGSLFFENAVLEAFDEHELSLNADGTLGLGRPFEKPWVENTDVNVVFSSPTAQPFIPLLGGLPPDMGPVVGSFRLTGSSDHFTIEELLSRLEDAGRLSIELKGQIGAIKPETEHKVSEIDLFARLTADSLPAFSSLVGTSFPEIGPLSAKARLRDVGEAYRLDDVEMLLGNKQELQLQASGSVARIVREKEVSLDGVDMEVSFQSPDTRRIGEIVGKEVPDFGALDGTFRLTGNNRVLAVSNANVSANSDDGLDISVTGDIGAIHTSGVERLSGIKLLVSFASPNTRFVSELAKEDLPAFGETEGSFLLTGTEAELSVSEAVISAISPDGLRIRAEGKIDSLKTGEQVSFRGVDARLLATAPESDPFEKIVGFNLPELGPVNLTAFITDSDGGVDVPEFHLRCGPEIKMTLSANGQIRNLGSGDNISLDAAFETRSKPWMQLAGRRPPEDIRLGGATKLVGSIDDFLLEEFQLAARDEREISLRANGTTKKSSGQYNLDIRVAAALDNADTINAVAGTSLPGVGPASMNGRLSGTVRESAFDGQISIGRTEFRIHESTVLGGERPKIEAKVSAPIIYVDDLGIFPEKSPAQKGTEKQKAKRKHIFSENPLPFERLKAVDLILDIDAEQVVSENHVLKDFDLDFNLIDGVLRTTAARTNYTGGSVQTELTIDASGSTPVVALKGAAEDVHARDVLRRLNKPLLLDGRVTLVADLKTAGNSPRELASTLDGEYAMAIEDGKLRRSADLLALDPLDLLTTLPAMVVSELPLPGMEDYTRLNCMALRFLFQDGIGASKIIFMDTTDIRVLGSGSVDLRTETIDLVLNPKPKKQPLGITSSVRVRGPLANPSIRKIPLEEAARIAGEILAPYYFLPARGLGYLWYLIRDDKDERSPCLDVVAPPD